MSDKTGKEISYEEFNERFESVEERLKYLGDSQEKWEWFRKADEVASRKRFQQIEAGLQQIEKNLNHTTRQLNHITKLTGIAFEEIEFQDEKLDVAGKALSRKRKK